MQYKFFEADVAHTEKYHEYDEIKFIYSVIKEFCLQNQIDFYTQFDNIFKGKHDRMVVVWTRELLPKPVILQELDRQCQASGKMLYVITDNLGHYPDTDNIKFFFRPQLLGEWKIFQDPPKVTTNQKLFSCFVQRVESVRQTWFYFLHIHGLLDQGHVSFWFDQLAGQAQSRINVYDHNHFNFDLHNLPHFHQAYLDLKPRVPFCNFDGNIEPLIASSKYSIVLDTYATDDDHTAFLCNEKTLRDLQFATQPLIFTQAGMLGELKKQGMCVPDYLDAVDCDQNWTQRQTKLVNILKQDAVDISDQENIDRALHNRNIMQCWRNLYHSKDFFDDIFSLMTQ
jgi:hypothetical protein